MYRRKQGEVMQRTQTARLAWQQTLPTRQLRLGVKQSLLPEKYQSAGYLFESSLVAFEEEFRTRPTGPIKTFVRLGKYGVDGSLIHGGAVYDHVFAL